MSGYIVKTYHPSGRLIDRFEFEARSDAEAQAAIGRLGRRWGTHELWSGRRCICTVPAVTTYHS